MTTQPEALRLADRLQDFALALPAYGFDDRPPKDAAAELRRLHAEVEALRAAQGEQEPWGYAVEGRIFVGAALPEHVQKMAAEHDFRVLKLYTSHVATSQEPQHPDDAAVDALSAAMKAKLAKQRAKGYGGWDTDCTQQRLSDMLRNHVDKGDPVDVANFCAFLLARGEGISAPVATQGELGVEIAAYALGELRIERYLQRDGSFKWAVRRLITHALNKQGEWEYEPQPSDREDDFMERCRFDSARAAIDAALSATPVATTKDDE